METRNSWRFTLWPGLNAGLDILIERAREQDRTGRYETRRDAILLPGRFYRCHFWIHFNRRLTALFSLLRNHFRLIASCAIETLRPWNWHSAKFLVIIRPLLLLRRLSAKRASRRFKRPPRHEPREPFIAWTGVVLARWRHSQNKETCATRKWAEKHVETSVVFPNSTRYCANKQIDPRYLPSERTVSQFN